MKKELLLDLYRRRGADEASAEQAVAAVEIMENWLAEQKTDFEHVTEDTVKAYVARLVDRGSNTLPVIMAIARWFYVIKRHGIYIYFTKLLGGRGVIENIRERMTARIGVERTAGVFKGLSEPPLGAPIESVPAFTRLLMERIEGALTPEEYEEILAGNNHRIPAAAMDAEKEFYLNSDSLETYLKERHDRKVAELQSFCDSNTVWFEQIITQDVVDFVKANQEMLSGVLENGKLYVTKIPYDTVGFLAAESDAERDYYACHCPFAREVIMSGEAPISRNWCYCSAGFAKFPFEQILGRELRVKLLDSALDGDGKCRFEIDLTE